MNTLKKITRHTIIGTVACLSLMISTSQAAQISISPLSTTTGTGEFIELSLEVSGLETENISVFDLDVLYDNSILEFVSYSLTDNLGVDGIDALDLSGPAIPGVVNISQTSLLDGSDPFFTTQADAFSLGTLVFKAVKAGESDLTMSINSLGDEFATSISNINVVNGSVTSVPEPATGALMIAGLLGLFTLVKKSSRRKS